MLPDAELRDLLVLHRRTAGNPRRLAKLMTTFGSARNALRDSTAETLAALDLADAVSGWGPPSAAERREVDADLRWLAGARHSLVMPGDERYPERLLEIHDEPPLLFCDGNADLLPSVQIAMVGSRKMSATGRKVAVMLASELCRSGVTVTSGLARGVDAASHEGALAAGGSTIAVLGSGCDVIYPPANKRLAKSIRDSDGLLVSEFPLRLGARDYHFPQRNRIVTGLSVGTVVVEAALRSGSLISARLAMEQGREVFAVPGSVLNPLSAGCHKLIRDGAKLTACLEDIIEEIAGIVPPPRAATASPLDRDQPRYRLVSMMGVDPVSVDTLVAASGLATAEVLGMLVDLEIDGVVVTAGGGYALSPEHARMLAEDDSVSADS